MVSPSTSSHELKLNTSTPQLITSNSAHHLKLNSSSQIIKLRQHSQKNYVCIHMHNLSPRANVGNKPEAARCSQSLLNTLSKMLNTSCTCYLKQNKTKQSEASRTHLVFGQTSGDEQQHMAERRTTVLSAASWLHCPAPACRIATLYSNC